VERQVIEWFQARITYSADWAKDGKEWAQVEGFQNEDFLTSYLHSMGWRIVKAERVQS
jgi:hypothetical protein